MKINLAVARICADHMRRGDLFPGVTIAFGRYDERFRICDGHNRTAASLLLGFSHIPAR